MMVFVIPDDQLNIEMSAESETIAETITITCIAISYSAGYQIQNYGNKEIWASYSYPVYEKTSV